MDLNEISRAGRFDLSDFRSLTAKNRLVQTGTLGGGILARDIYPATDATDPLTLDYFGGTSGTYVGYDRFGRVTRNEWTAGTATRSRYDYTYDRASNRLTRANGIDADFDETYTYDDLHRLATMTRRELGTGGTPARTEDWTLDAVGNWKEFDIAEDGSATLEQTRSVNNANELTGFVNTTGASWASPGYDAAGGMTAVPSPLDMTAALTAKYDAWNRLTELRDAASNLVAEYQYDAKNRRIRKVMADETYYDYYHDTGVRILEIRRNGDTDPLKQYIWSQRYLHSPVLRFRDADTDGQDIQIHYYLADANYNVTALADAAGEVIERYVYTPYGQRTLFNADYNSPAVYDNDIAFTGYRLDIESGLYYAPYRYQHPVLGLFVTRDPLGYQDGMNLYGYCGNRPVDYTDAFGQETDYWEGKDWWLGKGTRHWTPEIDNAPVPQPEWSEVPKGSLRSFPKDPGIAKDIATAGYDMYQNAGEAKGREMGMSTLLCRTLQIRIAAGEWDGDIFFQFNARSMDHVVPVTPSVQGALSDWGEEKLYSAVIYKDGEQCRLNAFHKKTERVWYTAWIKKRTLMVQDVSGCIINSRSVDCDCKR